MGGEKVERREPLIITPQGAQSRPHEVWPIWLSINLPLPALTSCLRGCMQEFTGVMHRFFDKIRHGKLAELKELLAKEPGVYHGQLGRGTI